MLLSVTVLSWFSLVHAVFFPNIYPRLKLAATTAKDAGDPLIITPYLHNDSIALAQNLSRVSLTDKLGVPSYAGFFTINKKYNSNLYFWYFPPVSKNVSAPVILWLQGGPGGSSLYGLFAEVGPLIATKKGFVLRKYHWALHYHLIFIDNPVGTGFSFTDSTNGYCTKQDCIAKGLHRSLKQFFLLFPNLTKNEFYIAGESYAGKYVPTLAMLIHRKNAKRKSKINLQGMAMGNAYCDPINQLDYGNYLYQHGLLDRNELKVFQKFQIDIYVLIQKENWLKANILMDRLMDGQVTHFSLFKFYTGYDYYFNYIQTTEVDDMSDFMILLRKNVVRQSVHVGGLPFQDGETVQLLLALDMLQSVAPVISKLLSHYRILFYNGQLDIVVGYPLTENFLHNLEFSAADDYRMARKRPWNVGKTLAGYIKKAGNLTEVLVRNAGHMVPKDKPKWALDLITRFVNNDL